MAPARNSPMASSVVPIGLRMKIQEKFIAFPRFYSAGPGATRGARGCGAVVSRARSRSM